MFERNSFDTSDQIYMMLNQEARKLKDIADSEWNRYLNSYTPKQYVRTHRATAEAIRVGHVKPIMGGEFLGIEVTWDNDRSYHDSYLFKQGKISRNERGHAFMLISDGWESKKLERIYGRRVYRHTYWEGSGYLAKVYSRYMAVRNPLVILDIQWSGKYTK